MDRFGRENNYWLGKKLSPEHREKIRLARIGKKFSETSKLKMRLSHLGYKHSEETKQKMGNAHKSKPNFKNRGRFCKPETREKLRILSSRPNPGQWNKGHIPWSKGKHLVSWNKGKQCPQLSGANNPAWRGGASFQEYPLGWKNTFKEQIRKRDGYKCQNCGCPETECRSKLHIHHIDYNKQNIREENLISLCHSCHAKTVCKNREYWKEYYAYKIYA